MPQDVKDRIDQVLRRNLFYEIAILVMAVFIFILGFTALWYGMSHNNVYIVAPATLITACLYWPIKVIIKMRKENIALAAAPSLISTLPADEAARELIKLLEKIT